MKTHTDDREPGDETPPERHESQEESIELRPDGRPQTPVK